MLNMSIVRSFLPVFAGICLGFTLNIMIAPFIDETCDPSDIRVPSDKVKLRETKSISDKEKPKEVVRHDNVEYPKPPHLENGQIKKIVRPRFASTELGVREKLFVAVLTSQDTVSSFALAVNKTTAHYVTKQMFFTTTKPSTVPPSLPLVSFSDKNNKHLPLHVLKYISEHHHQNYDYFMFMTDRTYIRAEKVYETVSHISVSEDVHMGAAGVLDETTGAELCSIEGGVIISQSVIQQALLDLDWCFLNAHDSNPSITLGRCIQHATLLTCGQQGGDKEFRHYKVHDFDYEDDISTLRNDAKLNSSLSVYPMPDDLSHYKIHRYFCQLELNLTRQEILKAKESMVHISHFTADGTDSLIWPLGTPEETPPKKRFDVLRWNYFTDTHMYFDDDFTNMTPLSGVDKEDIQEILQTAFDKANKLYKNTFKRYKLINGYRRFEPSRGMEYQLDLKLKERTSNTEVIKRFHLLRPLNKPEIVPMPYVTESSRVFIVLPMVEADIPEFTKFMDQFQNTVLEGQDNSVLCVFLLYKKQRYKVDPFTAVKSTISFYSKQPNYKNKMILKSEEINYSDVGEIEIFDKIMKDLNSDTLVSIASPGMEVDTDYLNRVRMNTIAGNQVFFPISYWQYKPNLAYDEEPYPKAVELNQKYGHFDALSFEHSSFYVSDYEQARKKLPLTETKNSSLINMFVKYQKLHIFRAAEPSLRHRWQNITCDESFVLQHHMCHERQYQHLATRAQLAKLVFEYEEDQEDDEEEYEEDDDDVTEVIN